MCVVCVLRLECGVNDESVIVQVCIGELRLDMDYCVHLWSSISFFQERRRGDGDGDGDGDDVSFQNCNWPLLHTVSPSPHHHHHHHHDQGAS